MNTEMDKHTDFSTQRERSEEVQEIMGQRPRALVRWGNALLLVLLAAFFAANAFLSFPETRAFPLVTLGGGEAQAWVAADDAARLRAGQHLWATLEIYPPDSCGRFAACVTRVDLVPGELGYGVWLRLDSATDKGKRLRLVPGMRGAASLKATRRGFLRHFLMNEKN